MKGRGTEKTEVYYNPFRVVSTVIDFIDNATGRIDGCVDQTRPLLLNDIEALRMAFNEARKRGVKIRLLSLFLIQCRLPFCQLRFISLSKIQQLAIV